jgi:hypothetical protein
MATRVIDDTKLNDIAVAIQAKDSGGRMTVDDMPTRIQAIQVADPDESLIEFFTNTIKYIKIDEECNIPQSVTSGDNQRAYSKLVFFSAKLAKEYLEAYTFRKSASLVYANVGMVNLIMNNAFSVTVKLTSLVIPNSAICPLQNTNAFSSSGVFFGNGYVWVYDSLVSGYQSATNWSVYASQIKGFSEAPIFDNSVTYSIGDVCQYNGRFYGYCKSDLTSSTGNPPTGTTADNDYWEYVADIEVI